MLPVEPARPEGNNWQKDVAHYPEPLTPFGWSLFEHVQRQVRAVFDEMGLLVRGLEERSVGGEIYGRVLPALGSPDAAGKPPPALVLGVAARLVPELRRRTARPGSVLREGTDRRLGRGVARVDRAEMQRRVAELGAVDLAGLDDAALAAHRERCLDLTRRRRCRSTSG